MGAVELIAMAGSLSLLAGWRMYLCVFATGIAMRTGWVALPENLESLGIFANPWILGAAFLGMILEFFADKISFLDSLWDGINTAIRPIGGALLAMAVIDANDPVWQIVVFLLGGGAALMSHGAKASTRVAVNTSPEPFSNVVVSTGEDVATAGLTIAVLANPAIAVVVFMGLLLFVTWILWKVRRFVRGILPKKDTG